MRTPIPRRISLGAAFTTFLALAGCAKPPTGKSEMPPAPVVVATVVKKTVPIQIRATGIVKSMSTYNVRPRVNGELTEVHFHEGEDVVKGQKLLTIDPRPYETAVKQAEASLAKNKALLEGAERDLTRAERAANTGVASREDLDTARTAVGSTRASVAADEAALQSAKLQLGYTTITSPIEGRTGELLVTPGNLVNTNSLEPLVKVVQISPIDVSFPISEQLLPTVDAARRQGPVSVLVQPRSSDPPVTGLLSFTDNAVDTMSGTVQLKAEFKNENRKLWPGNIVDVILTTGERKDSVVVPTSALQSGQKGQYVYIVVASQKVELRYVTVAFEEGGDAVIASGLKGGETVVVEGQLRLAPGVKVDIKGTITNPKGSTEVSKAKPAMQLPGLEESAQ